MNWTLLIIVLLIYFTAWYALATAIKNAGIIDIGWGLGFVVLAAMAVISNPTGPNMVVFALIALWGLRLAYHIGKRNLGKPEDFRYANFRKEWGKSFFVRAYVQLFLFQGLLMAIISMAHLYGMDRGIVQSLPLFLLGILVFVIGLSIESIGDVQLKRHISDPSKKGTLIRSGLWQYTRHPNYFGEAVLWWGIFGIALGLGAPIWTIMSPIVITYLLRFVSGVPMLEKRMQKYPDFDDYAKTTNIFVLWFKKK